MALETVVVTGIGIISPLGNSFETLMDALQAGGSGVREVPELEKIGGLRSRLAATVEGVDPQQIPRKIRRSMRCVPMGGWPLSASRAKRRSDPVNS